MNDALKIVSALLAIITSAYISVTLPISEQGIPFTAQSLVIFIIATLLSPRDFIIVILIYLLAGAIGLPVFADGESGFSKLLGPSGGFLIGFLFAGLFISYRLHEKASPFTTVLINMIAGTIILFFFGLTMLTYQFGFDKALQYGFYPFWAMALVKAILAACCVFVFSNRR